MRWPERVKTGRLIPLVGFVFGGLWAICEHFLAMCPEGWHKTILRTVGGVIVLFAGACILWWLRADWLKPKKPGVAWLWLSWNIRKVVTRLQVLFHSLMADFGPSPDSIREHADHAENDVNELSVLFLDDEARDDLEDREITYLRRRTVTMIRALRTMVYDPLNDGTADYDEAERIRRKSIMALWIIGRMVESHWQETLLNIPKATALTEIRLVARGLGPRTTGAAQPGNEEESSNGTNMETPK